MRFLKLVMSLCALITIVAAIAFLSVRVCFEKGEDYTFFCGNTSKDCREVATNTPALSRLVLFNVCGESATYKNFDLQSYLTSVDGKIVFEEKLDDSVNYYCTANLPYSILLYGKKINLHISIKKESVKVGSPIIFGGY